MRRVGKDIDAAERWRDVAASYANNIDGAYHAHRLSVIRALLPPLSGKSVLDFGCGEGVLMAEALSPGGAAEVFGLDIDETMVALARRRVPEARTMQGGVSHLADFGPVDCLIAANVLAYMTDAEEEQFYRSAARIMRPRAHLVVTHSNTLFDLSTFNAFTVDFCRREFGFDPSPLITHPELDRASFNIRENPLAYRHKLARYGFVEERQEFINFHPSPRLLSGDDPDDMSREKRNTLDWPEAERWKLMFQCSMFGSRAVRV
jgi:SAM-dependent methyltransferase